MSTEFGRIDVEFGGGSVDAEAVTLRGRAAGAGLTGAACAAAGWAEVNRAKSLRMFRAASQPDKSNNPITTACLIRLLIVIPAYPKNLSKRA